jgi:lysine methyltransferase
LSPTSNVLELGCGVSGLLSLVLAPKVKTYIATDQQYVLKTLKTNLLENQPVLSKSYAPKRAASKSDPQDRVGNIQMRSLDWEKDSVASLYSELGISLPTDRIDVVIACDCIYNEPLIEPFVTTCADICQLSPVDSVTLCVVAQQLRSPDVFESWLKMFFENFHTWRLPDEVASSSLGENSGFVVHIGVLRNRNIKP